MQDMSHTKSDIVILIRKSFENKVSNFFIIGSFLSDDWSSENSDIDIVCVDKSFEEYPYFENKKYVRNILSNIPYKFDIFIYTPKQFNDKLLNDLRFHKQIIKGANLYAIK
jgi:predicted nucleotidyltransferase